MILVQSYATALFELSADIEEVKSCGEVFRDETVYAYFASPVVEQNSKQKLIDRLFSGIVGGFLKTLCNNQHFDFIFDIINAYDAMWQKQNNVITAQLSYKFPPDDRQLKAIENFIKTKYQVQTVNLQLRQDGYLLGGCVLRVGNDVYDRSVRNLMTELGNKLKRR